MAEDGQQYARVVKRFGDARFEVMCLGDGVQRLAHVRGKLWKRVWVSPHDLVLVGLRAWQDQRVDIVHKYTDDEERTLVQAKEIPFSTARCDEDDERERELQAVRDVHGVARAGFLPSEAEFGFASDPEDG